MESIKLALVFLSSLSESSSDRLALEEAANLLTDEIRLC